MKGLKVLFAFLCSSACVASSTSPPGVAQISVRGEGMVARAPDMAIVTIGVSSNGETGREALAKNNQDMERVLTGLKTLGIQERDLQTSSFQLHPVYNYKQDPPLVVGYRASNSLTVRIRDIEMTGRVLDTSVSLGVNNALSNIQFSNSDSKEILKEARRKAVKDALEKAETIVDELNVGLGPISSISEGHLQDGLAPRPMSATRGMAMEASSSVPISSGENSYRVAVDITWEIATNSCTENQSQPSK